MKVTTVQKQIQEKRVSEQDQENEMEEYFIAASHPALGLKYKKILKNGSRQL